MPSPPKHPAKKASPKRIGSPMQAPPHHPRAHNQGKPHIAPHDEGKHLTHRNIRIRLVEQGQGKPRVHFDVLRDGKWRHVEDLRQVPFKKYDEQAARELASRLTGFNRVQIRSLERKLHGENPDN